MASRTTRRVRNTSLSQAASATPDSLGEAVDKVGRDKGVAAMARAMIGQSWDCPEFRVRAGIVGWKETPHAPTQTACDRRLAA
jgi:hypothetical protein